MKTNRQKWLSIAARLSLMALAFYILHRVGVNPFWSLLAMLYWKTLLRFGLLLGGLLWFAHTVMN